MIATFYAQDYLIFLEPSKKEAESLLEGKMLESNLLESGNNLGKIVKLYIQKNEGVDGISSKNIPSGKGWDNILQIHFVMDYNAYTSLVQNGKVGTRISSYSCVEILNGTDSYIAND